VPVFACPAPVLAALVKLDQPVHPVPPAAVPTPQVTVLEPEADDNFDVRCTAKLENPRFPIEQSGLFLGYRSGGPYFEIGLNSACLSLERVNGNRRTTLGWYQTGYAAPSVAGTPLAALWRDGDLRVIYDGRTVIHASGLGSIDGGVGFSSGAGNLNLGDAEFQPVEPVHFADDFMRTADAPDLWTPVSGNWKLNTDGDTNLGANPFTYRSVGKGSISVVGHWFWNDYRAGCSVKPEGQDAVGLIINWQDPNNYLACKWYGADSSVPEDQKKQLWRVYRGQATMIDAAPGGYQPNQWYRLQMNDDQGALSVFFDGVPALAKVTSVCPEGEVGLLADSDSQTTFDDVKVEPVDYVEPPQVDQVAAGPARFAKDDSMETWSSPSGQWLASTGEPTLLWNRGSFFGDYSVEIQAGGVTTPGSAVRMVLSGDGTTADSGYCLLVKATTSPHFVTCTLSRAGQPVTVESRKLVEDPAACEIALKRVGNTIIGLVNDAEVAQFTDNIPLTGRRVGYDGGSAQVDLVNAHVLGGNMLDYTFYEAPVDWWTQSGTWQVASRWICTPTWTWFAGWSDRVAAVWNKRNFDGDFAIEVFAASKMDDPSPPYYLHPRDLNITICGDGRDLSSGYSCIFGGWNDTETRILRGNKVVAETSQVLLPPSDQYHAVAHHKWFCLRVEKTGDTISYYIDRKLALQYKDPNPLTGKNLALWTCGNGIMVARATIYYQGATMSEPKAVAIPVAGGLHQLPGTPSNWMVRNADTGVTLSTIAPATPSDPPALRALNLAGGGNFSVLPRLAKFDALKSPLLSFGTQIQPGAAINLYLASAGDIYSVHLCGPAPKEEADGVQSLGSADVPADGAWHDVHIDLDALFKAINPTATEIPVDEVFLGNLAKDDYVQGGFGANYPGTSYLVRGFTVKSSDGKIVQVADPTPPGKVSETKGGGVRGRLGTLLGAQIGSGGDCPRPSHDGLISRTPCSSPARATAYLHRESICRLQRWLLVTPRESSTFLRSRRLPFERRRFSRCQRWPDSS